MEACRQHAAPASRDHHPNHAGLGDMTRAVPALFHAINMIMVAPTGVVVMVVNAM
jgi:hypothetical protein